MQLMTERLILREFRADDAPEMFRCWTYDENVARYCRWYAHSDVSVTERLLAGYLAEQESGFNYRWAITSGETGELMGCVDVVAITDEGKTAHIGYVLGRRFWGHGYMTEAVSAVIEYLFAEGFTCVKAEHHIDNPASGRVMQKCGMAKTGQAEFQAKFGSDELCTVDLYEIRKDPDPA